MWWIKLIVLDIWVFIIYISTHIPANHDIRYYIMNKHVGKKYDKQNAKPTSKDPTGHMLPLPPTHHPSIQEAGNLREAAPPESLATVKWLVSIMWPLILSYIIRPMSWGKRAKDRFKFSWNRNQSLSKEILQKKSDMTYRHVLFFFSFNVQN